MDSELSEPLDRVRDELRRSVSMRPDFDARVMQTLRHLPPPRRLGGLLAWWLRPAAVRLSPLGAMLAAAALAALVVAGSQLLSARFALEPLSAGPRRVRFRLDTPGVSRVSLIGEFNDWNPAAAPLHRESANVWVVDIPLDPGRHRYAFLIDGTRWATDPAAPTDQADDFGMPNSIVTVAERT